ncbi:MAG: hypothetical protein LBF02_02535 [Mycoplasmataceae bacterium]|jgi:hypothetical protein|nr:hypothetical protein [Mycoplasmataceae bacterium]
MKTFNEVKNMTDAEWEEFRIQEWNETRNKKISAEIPNFYLKDKNSYIDFITKTKKSSHNPDSIDETLRNIENLNDEEWQVFRKQKWEEKQKMYESSTPPEWFMTKESYLAFLHKIGKDK